ncbi:hypothetical protein DH2020_029405 [Rehmannia glutinosa]|uniref:DDE Tnp4 domain-containing protein n=1 Tax=Rehmannia glutinosa TaxID=99300 RepID=A0ABR0VNQ3_REHGL
MSEISRRIAEIFLLIEEIVLDSVFIVNMFASIIRKRAQRRLIHRKQGTKYKMADRIPKQIEHSDDLILHNDTNCLDNLRMTRGAFAKLCYLLKHVGGLRDSRYVSINEKAALYLSVLAHHKKNRIVRFDFKRSGQTISRHFHDVLNAVLRLHNLLLVNPEPVDDNYTNPRWSSFKGCLGFAADCRVLHDAIHRPNGLKILQGFLTPYKGVRYHLDEWGEGNSIPQNPKEYFNMTHSKAHNVIERAFGLLKKRWAILRSQTFYDIKVQNRMIMACVLLHNFIRLELHVDPIEELSSDDDEDDHEDNENVDFIDTVEPSQFWTNWRDNLAQSMFNEWRGVG